jgi:hypothetical protein
MCNAYNHPADCECGFGPPYPVKVHVLKLPDPKDRNPADAGRLALEFLAIRAHFFDLLSQEERAVVMTEIGKAVQSVSDERFGDGKVRIAMTVLKKGTLSLEFVLIVAIGVYKFFKDYEALREGVQLFAGDVQAVSKKLSRVARRVYSREERKARRKQRRRDEGAGATLVV